MGASCSKGSSVGISGQQLQPQSSFSQYSNSPYLADNASFTNKSGYAAKSARDIASGNDLIQAQHDVLPPRELLPAPTDVSADATAIAADGTQPEPASSSLAQSITGNPAPSTVQQSLQEAAAVYTQPVGRSPHRSPAKVVKTNSHAKQAIARSKTLSGALKALGSQASPDAAIQLLQHYLFSKQAVSVTELDTTVAAIAGQPAQIQAVLAILLVQQQYYFAAMKATFTHPRVLSRVLQDIQQQVRLFWLAMMLVQIAVQYQDCSAL